jgi:thymidylate synthase (FAD)
MSVKLQWATPDIDKQILYIARLSNPDKQDNPDTKLLNFLMREGHVSPFQMANVCLEIRAPRDISRQIMRHWTMYLHELDVQEFSQRYQDAAKLPQSDLREARMQDTKNRQNSLPCADAEVAQWWQQAQQEVLRVVEEKYQQALALGIAKEQARVVLPEGLTPSVFFLNGTMRSWIFYLQQRLHLSTQKEHRVLAEGVVPALRLVAPVTMAAFFPTQEA